MFLLQAVISFSLHSPRSPRSTKSDGIPHWAAQLYSPFLEVEATRYGTERAAAAAEVLAASVSGTAAGKKIKGVRASFISPPWRSIRKSASGYRTFSRIFAKRLEKVPAGSPGNMRFKFWPSAGIVCLAPM